MERSRILLQKNKTFSHSFTFTFFAKERCVLFRSLEKNEKERNALLGLISCQNLEKERKRMEKNGKEWNVPFKERKRTWCPTQSKMHYVCYFIILHFGKTSILIRSILLHEVCQLVSVHSLLFKTLYYS